MAKTVFNITVYAWNPYVRLLFWCDGGPDRCLVRILTFSWYAPWGLHLTTIESQKLLLVYRRKPPRLSIWTQARFLPGPWLWLDHMRVQFLNLVNANLSFFLECKSPLEYLSVMKWMDICLRRRLNILHSRNIKSRVIVISWYEYIFFVKNFQLFCSVLDRVFPFEWCHWQLLLFVIDRWEKKDTLVFTWLLNYWDNLLWLVSLMFFHFGWWFLKLVMHFGLIEKK